MERIILWWVGFFIRRMTSGDFIGWLRTYTMVLFDWRSWLAILRNDKR